MSIFALYLINNSLKSNYFIETKFCEYSPRFIIIVLVQKHIAVIISSTNNIH